MSVALILAIFAVLAAFLATLRANPQWWLTQHLFSSWGPRTDTAFMTRRELFANSLRFVVLALLTFGALLLGGLIGEFFAVDPTAGTWTATTAAVFGVFLMILTGMFTLGALVLFVHGIFRRRNYVPPSVSTEPDARSRRGPYVG